MSDTSAGSSAASFAVSESPTRPKIANSLIFNLIVPLALLTLGAGFLVLMGKVEPKARVADDTTRVGRLRSLPPVQVERLHEIDVNETPLRLSVDGTVVPFREARVAAEVAGQVVYKSELCEAGNFVKQGEVLMRIDRTDYELEVQRLTRLKQQEYQALAEIDQELTNTSRSLDVATQDLALQQAEVDRQSSLPPGFASRGEIDRAKRSLLQATQALVTLENNAALLKKRRERLESSEQLAATQLKVAEVNLARTEIRAPIDGVIAAENADLNTFVARGNTLVTIEDTSKVEVATNLRMDQLYWVLDQGDHPANGQAAESSGYELPETPAIIEYELNGREAAFYRWEGRLLGYDGIGLDPNTRTVPVRVIVDDPREFLDEQGARREASGPSALVRGMYVRVNLMIKPKTPLVVIPARCSSRAIVFGNLCRMIQCWTRSRRRQSRIPTGKSAKRMNELRKPNRKRPKRQTRSLIRKRSALILRPGLPVAWWCGSRFIRSIRCTCTMALRPPSRNAIAKAARTACGFARFAIER